MAIFRQTLTTYLDQRLNLKSFANDCSNNGLQVEGKDEIRKVVFAVDASLELIRKAIDCQADYIFVHHGLSWGAEPRYLTSWTGQRFRELFQHNISLYGAHLPLDAHPELGNNIQLAKILDLQNLQPFCQYRSYDIGFVGDLPEAMKTSAVADILSESLGSAGAIFQPEKEIRKVGIVSGGAGQDGLFAALDAGADLLITGEVCHEMIHPLKESSLALIAPGHYLTETVGPKAVMDDVKKQFALDCQFIDLPTGY